MSALLFVVIFFAIAGLWLAATVFCACKLAKDADALVEHLTRQQRNQRRHNLGKWLQFHGSVK